MREEAPKPISRGLAYWSDAVIGGPAGIDDQRRSEMIAHPRFTDAGRLLVSNVLARRRSSQVFMRANKDLSRLFLSHLSLYLDAQGGLTLSSIRDLCTEMNIASPGRAAAILLRMRMIGYVRLGTEERDRRVRRYIPTDELKDAIRGSFRDQLEALALIEPEAARAGERLSEPDFFQAYMRRNGKGLVEMVKRHRGSNVIELFSERNEGLAILFDIVASAEPGDTYPPRGRVKMSVTDLAMRYEVSRSHVLKILRDAEREGLMHREPDERIGVLTEKLHAGLIALHVAQLFGGAACARAAYEATSSEPARAARASA
jgi:DNA-binding MarR family transcriptional regulator